MNWSMINILCSLVIKNKYAAVFLLFIISEFPVLAQQETNSIALRTYLTALEKQFAVSFTYVDKALDNVYITPPNNTLTINQALAYLRANTELDYEQLDNRFIAIVDKRKVGGNICGYLIDEIDHKAIEAAVIKLGDDFTTSDANGFFSIENLNTDNNLIIEALGYKLRELSSDGISNDCSIINLTPEIRQLNEITIYNFITKGINKQADGSFSLNVEDLGILPGLIEPDILQGIQALPGIQSNDETVSHLNVRGGTNDQNLVLWDGIKMYQTGHFFGLISAFNPYLNKNVTITKNGTSAAYTDGVSSVINIQSDTDVTKKFNGGAGINMLNADAYFKIPVTRKITLQLAGRRSVTDVVNTPIFTNYFNRVFGNTEVINTPTSAGDTTFNSNENFYFYDLEANLLIDITKNDKLRVHFLDIFNALDYAENITRNAQTITKNSSLTQQSIAAGASYRRLWGNKLSSIASVYLSSYQLNGVNSNILNNQQLIQENEVLDTGLKLETLYSFNSSWELLSGYQFIEVGIGNLEDINNPEYYRYIKQVIRSHALFTEGKYLSPSGKSTIIIGIRGNYYHQFTLFQVEPRLVFNQQLSSSLNLEVLGELKSQTATQVIDLQNDFLGVEKRRWVLANGEDIPIVQSRQISTGLNLKKAGFLISLDLFYKYVSGITSASQGFQNQYQSSRTSGSYEVWGSELLINKHFKNLSLWAGYTFNDNKYQFANFTPSIFASNFDIRHSATFGVNWNFNDFEISTGANWHSGKPFTSPDSVINNSIVYQEANSARLNDYLRIDFSVRYTFNISSKIKGQVGGAIWNVTNHNNIFNIYYELDKKGQIQEIQQSALGITPNLMFRIKF